MSATDSGRLSVDELVDEASMESFPASDPPSYWGRESPRDPGDQPEARAAPDETPEETTVA